MIWTTPRTARTPHWCGGCNRHIQPGERYNEGVAAPNDNDLGNEGWWRLAECSRCAERYGRPIPAAAARGAA